MEDLCQRFGVALYENMLEDLSRLQQTTMVAAYLGKFEDLLNKVEGQFGRYQE